MKKNKREPWLKPRGYIHFTSKFDLKDIKQVKFITSYASNPISVAKHPFSPLIHRPIIARRYKVTSIDSLGKKKRAHSFIDPETGKRRSNAKIRHIYYSTHLDAFIYSYYCQKVLTPLYELRLSETPGLSNCVSAYRKIPISSESEKNKNNIYFAKDVFDFIKTYGDCVALTFDVSAFFDSLNQKYLKKQWCNLLNTKSLPDDHHHIYKSLTRISYVEFYTVLKEFGIKSQYWFKNKKHVRFCKDADEFRRRIRNRGYLKTHPYRVKNMPNEYIGIPQGTPISAFLSNLYLLEFDKLIHTKVEVKGGLYRRYSDDIVVVCKPENVQEIKDYVLDIIKNKFYLKINKDKVDKSEFTATEKGVTCDKPLRYLGFEFDGKRTLIKPASLSKFYRNMKRAVVAQANKAKKGKYPSTSRMYKFELYKQYSHLGSKTKGRKRNFYAYAKDASEIMQEKAIMKQFSRAWENLMTEIKEQEMRLASIYKHIE